MILRLSPSMTIMPFPGAQNIRTGLVIYSPSLYCEWWGDEIETDRRGVTEAGIQSETVSVRR